MFIFGVRVRADGGLVRHLVVELVDNGLQLRDLVGKDLFAHRVANAPPNADRPARRGGWQGALPAGYLLTG